MAKKRPAKKVTKSKKAAKPKPKKPAAKSKKKKPTPEEAGDAGALIDLRIEELGDWRGDMLSRLRSVIRDADPEIVEEWKWSVPVWSNDGIICTGETYKKAVKLTFARGASIGDPSKLFNSSLEGNTRRAIDFAEGAKIDTQALTDLIRTAVALNKGA